MNTWQLPLGVMKDYDSLSCGVGQLGSLGTDCMASRVPPDSVVPHMGLTHRLPTSSCSQVALQLSLPPNYLGHGERISVVSCDVSSSLTPPQSVTFSSLAVDVQDEGFP